MKLEPYAATMFKQSAIFLALVFILFSCTNNDVKKDKTIIDKKDSVETLKTEPLLQDSVLAKMKTIYFTCDDGPNYGSRIMMNIAKEENIPVAFFCVGLQFTGQNLKYFSTEWQRMHTQPGVEVFNHGFTHAMYNRYEYFYSHPDTVLYDFTKAYDSAKYNTKICRANGNNIWRTPTISHDTYKRYNKAIEKLTATGFSIIGWDNEWFHYKSKLKQTPEQMVEDCEKMFANNDLYTPHHLVLLSHDQSFADAEDSASVHQFIKLLKAKPEYRFEKISRYPGLIK